MRLPTPKLPSRRHRQTAPAIRNPLVVLVAAILVVGLISSSPASANPSSNRSPRGDTHCGVNARLIPTCSGALSGAYVRPHTGEDYSTAVARFERESSHRTQILHFYYRGDRLFPSSDEKTALRQGSGRDRILFAGWKPDDGYTWRQVADGAADARLLREATYLKQTWNRKMFLTVHHEPEDEVRDWAGSGYEAADYRAMFRHVEQVFQESGLTKIVWVMNYMGAQKWALSDWYDDLWPGWRYADWIAFDPYKTAGLGGQEGDFATLVNQYWGASSWQGAYDWARRNHPHRPVMLAEWGVGERDGQPKWKADFFRGIAPLLASYPMLRALVYFDNDVADAAGNVSVDTSPTSLAGFRDYLSSGAIASIG